MLAVGEDAARIAGLQNGTLAAIVSQVPANFFAHKVGGHTLLPLGEYMETLLAGAGVSQKKLEQNRDEVKRVVRALLRSLDFMHAQPVEIKNLIQKRLGVSETAIVDHIYGLVTKYATRNGIPSQKVPGSSWADYDKTLLSKGGGVFPRTAKSIPISAEVRRALDVDAETLTPRELIQAILRAPVDLLWNGGIGTYVKARAERHVEVGDRANDAVRVDAEDLRAKVVGEGGNLGLTQRARVVYALGGGRIFMDAIDNSAGVDCSDHEVNIKILLDSIVAEGDLTGKQRNELLAEMTDEVGTLVLRDNYDQAQAITSSVAQASSMAEVHERYVRSLEQAGVLSRELEALPSIEAFEERAAASGGLTAPGVRDPPLAHEDRALAGAPRLRSPRRPVPRDGARALLPDPTARALPRATPAPLAAARDHRDPDRERPRQPGRHDVSVPARRRDGRRAGRDRPCVYGRARGCGAPRALGGDRSSRRQGARCDPDRDAASVAHPARADDSLAPPPPAPTARHRGDRGPLRAWLGGARGGAARAPRAYRARGGERPRAGAHRRRRPGGARRARLPATVARAGARHRRDRGGVRARRRLRRRGVLRARASGSSCNGCATES